MCCFCLGGCVYKSPVQRDACVCAARSARFSLFSHVVRCWGLLLSRRLFVLAAPAKRCASREKSQMLSVRMTRAAQAKRSSSERERVCVCGCGGWCFWVKMEIKRRSAAHARTRTSGRPRALSRPPGRRRRPPWPSPQSWCRPVPARRRRRRRRRRRPPPHSPGS